MEDEIEYGDVKGKRLFFSLTLFYILWIVTAFLAFIVLLVGRTFVLTFMGTIEVGYFTWGFFDKLAFIVSGLAVLAVVVVSEYYLRSGIQKRRLVKRFCRIAGIEVLLLFVFHLCITGFIGFATANWLSWALIAVELVVGGALFAYSQLSISNRLIQI